MPAPLTLTEAQRATVLETLEASKAPQSHQAVWLRRSYAPGCIFAPGMRDVREAIESALPGYSIAFDVIFQSDGKQVDWHCDYESIGPFDVSHPWCAIRDSHFVSVHFNLTADGGRLCTLPWVWLSWIHYTCIVWVGIFSVPHRLLNAICRPLFRWLGTRHTNAPCHGNAFGNMRLHSVTEGAPRTSYVVRLARKQHVTISRNSIESGMARSAACQAFRPLLRYVQIEGTSDVSAVPWSQLTRGEAKENAKEEREKQVRAKN